jgi:serine/threonine protein kinase
LLCFVNIHHAAARNLLVVKVNDRYSVKVSDFGLAAMNVENNDQQHNQSIPIRWAAPEILQGTTYSTKSDVYR